MRQFDPDNIFVRIIRGEVPSAKVYEDEHVYAFNDIEPAAPVHVLVVPKGEYVSFDDFVKQAPAEKVAAFFVSVRKVAEQLGLSESGYRLITNHGRDAAQTVFHFHLHILGGRPMGALLASNF